MAEERLQEHPLTWAFLSQHPSMLQNLTEQNDTCRQAVELNLKDKLRSLPL